MLDYTTLATWRWLRQAARVQASQVGWQILSLVMSNLILDQVPRLPLQRKGPSSVGYRPPFLSSVQVGLLTGSCRDDILVRGETALPVGETA